MKTHLGSMFLFVFLIIFSIGLYSTWQATTNQRENTKYTTELTAACMDAIKCVDVSKTNVFEDEASRVKAVSQFFKTIAACDGKFLTATESIKEQTPFILLVDNDGFYLSHNIAFDKARLSVVNDPQVTSGISGLNTWAELKNGYIVRYFLNDHIEVVTPSNMFYEGSYKELAYLPIFNNKADYELSKVDCIVQSIEDEINHLLNTQCLNGASELMGYDVTLPKVSKETWSRMLKNPTIISFMQGKTKRLVLNQLNVFAYAGSEKIKEKFYYTDSNYYYNTNVVTSNQTTIAENGVNISVKASGVGDFDTMEHAAKSGKNPDITAFSENGKRW